MATKKTAKKTSKRAELNIPQSDGKVSKKSAKQVERKMKKAGPIAVLVIVVFFVVGLLGGYLTFLLTSSNDCFDMLGKEEITLTLDEKYIDEGVKIIEFGKDISENVEYDTNLLSNGNEFYAEEVGTYYIKYSVDSFKYGKIFKIQKVRLITFVESSEGGE